MVNIVIKYIGQINKLTSILDNLDNNKLIKDIFILYHITVILLLEIVNNVINLVCHVLEHLLIVHLVNLL